jgi:two-component system LytT family response regulator
VIVRHSPERHTDGLRHVADSAVLAAPHPRPQPVMPGVSHDDVSFGGTARRTRLVNPSTENPTVESSADGQPEVILVKSGFKQVATRVREIMFVEAARNYVRIHLETGTVLKSRVPIDRLGLHLGRQRFLRIHRGCLVNVDRIRALTSLLGGRLLLTLSDGSKVTVARDRRRFVLGEIGAGPAKS